jgi:hypothetical protein
LSEWVESLQSRLQQDIEGRFRHPAKTAEATGINDHLAQASLASLHTERRTQLYVWFISDLLVTILFKHADPRGTPMDFMRILQSLEEFLYEVMSWLVFYPRALWRTVRHPVAVAIYTVRQLRQDKDRQFTEMIGPPLMLILTIVVAHVIELSTPSGMARTDSALGKQLFATEQGIIVTRSIIYCLFALFGAMGMLRRQRTPINRDTLRQPFYIHCYLLAPFALGLAIATAIVTNAHGAWILPGLLVALLSCVWYGCAQTAIYAKILKTSLLRAAWMASAANAVATVVIVGLAFLLFGIGHE